MRRPVPTSEAQRWLDAYARVSTAASRTARTRCPSCGRKDLHLVHLSFGSVADAVMPAFWCGACLRGMPPARASLQAWATAVPHDRAALPHYLMVR